MSEVWFNWNGILSSLGICHRMQNDCQRKMICWNVLLFRFYFWFVIDVLICSFAVCYAIKFTLFFFDCVPGHCTNCNQIVQRLTAFEECTGKFYISIAFDALVLSAAVVHWFYLIVKTIEFVVIRMFLVQFVVIAFALCFCQTINAFGIRNSDSVKWWKIIEKKNHRF